MIDVLIATFKDLSNVAWRTSECLKSLGLNVRVFKAMNHMEYGHGCELISMHRIKGVPYAFRCPKLTELAKEAKVLHFTSGTFIDTGINNNKKSIVFQCGGRPLVGRGDKRAATVNYVNKFVDYSILQHPCLLNVGLNNPVLIKTAIDSNSITPVYNQKYRNKLVVGHFPSNKRVKGTDKINKVIQNLKKNYNFEYLTSTDRVPWDKQLERVSECDVIIECLTPVFKGFEFGEWGAAALESASLGKITVTNSRNENIYEREYCKSDLVVANTRKQLKKKLIKILNMSDKEILKKKIKTRKWIERNHSMEATSQRLWEKVYKNLL